MAQLEKAIKAPAVKFIEEKTGKPLDETGKTCGIFQNEAIVNFVLKQGMLYYFPRSLLFFNFIANNA